MIHLVRLSAWLWLLVLAACRIDYDPLADGMDASMLGDAEAADAPDGSVDTSACDRPTTFICDTFDEGVHATTVYGDTEWLALAGPDGTGAFRANGAPNASAVAIYEWTDPITAGPLHARVRLRIAPGDPIENYAVLLQLDNGVETSGREKVSADMATGDALSIAAPFSGRGGETTLTMPRERWVCLELAIAVDASGTMEVFLDGTRMHGYDSVDTVVPGGFRRLIISSLVSDADPPVDILFDDLVAATAPIGCY